MAQWPDSTDKMFKEGWLVMPVVQAIKELPNILTRMLTAYPVMQVQKEITILLILRVVRFCVGQICPEGQRLYLERF